MKTFSMLLAAFALGIISREVVEKYLRYREQRQGLLEGLRPLGSWRRLMVKAWLFWEA